MAIWKRVFRDIKACIEISVKKHMGDKVTHADDEYKLRICILKIQTKILHSQYLTY